MEEEGPKQPQVVRVGVDLLTDAEAARLRFPLRGDSWLASQEKRHSVLAILHDALREDKRVTAKALTSVVGVRTAEILIDTLKEVLGQGMVKSSTEHLVRILQYLDWADAHGEEARARYIRLHPEHMFKPERLDAERKRPFGELTTLQQRIGELLLREYDDYLKKTGSELKPGKLVEEVAGVMVKNKESIWKQIPARDVKAFIALVRAEKNKEKKD